MIIELKYSNTNTYLVKGDGYVLFDTGWAGTFDAFCKELGEKKISVNEIKYIMISHFHPDHMGIAEGISSFGPQIVVFDVQKEYVHYSDNIFAKEKHNNYKPIDDDKIKYSSLEEGKELLKTLGIDGEVIHTPGHSDDSISVVLESGEALVGDLNPLYELDLHKGTAIYESWQKILSRNPKVIYYGHAKTANVDNAKPEIQTDKELFGLVNKIIKYIDKGYDIETITKKTKSSFEFVDDVTRMYLTHRNVGVQGILDRIEIKGR